MPILPSTARSRLSKRRAWLIARSDDLRQKEPERATYFLDEEVEALDFVLGILEAVGGAQTGGARASEEERVQRAKDVLAAREKVCICAKCPVHGKVVHG